MVIIDMHRTATLGDVQFQTPPRVQSERLSWQKSTLEISVEDKSPGRIVYGSAGASAESVTDYRERMLTLQAEALERRQQQLHEQASPLNSPAERIRIWERLHQLELPRDPAHRLIAVIAANTGLSVDEVLMEQRARATGPVAPATPAQPL